MRSLRKRVRKFLPDWMIVIRRLWTSRAYRNFIFPKTLNEKSVHRILFDRRPVLTQMADKAAARSYVEARLGPQLLPKLYHLTTRPETIPFDELPQKFVVKPTHGSGWVQLVADKANLDRAALIATCKFWLSQNYYELTREWAYKNIKPQILVEEFIDDGNGMAPNDYKLFVFDGAVKCIQVDMGRFTDHRRRVYSPAWKKLDVFYTYDDLESDIPPPPHFAEMIAAAEALGKNIDFVRADFYNTPAQLYFGELTTTPGAGIEPIHPKEFDRALGDCWKLHTRRRYDDISAGVFEKDLVKR